MNKNLLFLLYLSIIIFLLSLSLFNLNSFLEKPKVLGTTNNVNYSQLLEERLFWQDFLNQHPSYFPGWTELAEIDSLLGNAGAGKP